MKLTLTPELQDEICRLVKVGVPESRAAASCGIQQRTLTRWKRKGQDDEDGPFATFFDALASAKADYIASTLGRSILVVPAVTDPDTSAMVSALVGLAEGIEQVVEGVR